MAFPIFKEMFPRCEIICYNHQINHRVTCSKCFMRFKSNLAVWKHAKKCKEVDLYKFFPAFAVRTPTGMYKCSICSEENLPTKKSLKKHLDNDHKVFQCPFSWSFCPLVIHGYCCLREHLHDHHNVPKGFACTTCKKQFYRKSSLRKHQKTHYICSAAIVLPYSRAFWSMPLYTNPPLFGDGSSGHVYSGMLQIIRGLEHAPLSETLKILDEPTNEQTHKHTQVMNC